MTKQGFAWGLLAYAIVQGTLGLVTSAGYYVAYLLERNHHEHS